MWNIAVEMAKGIIRRGWKFLFLHFPFPTFDLRKDLSFFLALFHDNFLVVIEDGFREGSELQAVDYFIGEMMLIFQYFSIGFG